MQELRLKLQTTQAAMESALASLEGSWGQMHAALSKADSLGCDTKVETAAMQAEQRRVMNAVPICLTGRGTSNSSWPAMQGILPAMAEAATLEPEAVDYAARLYEKVSGMSPHQGCLRAARVQKSCKGANFAKHFGLLNLESVALLADICNVVEPYELAWLTRPLNEEEKQKLDDFANLIRNPAGNQGSASGNDQATSATAEATEDSGDSGGEDEDDLMDADDGGVEQDLNGPSAAHMPTGRPVPQFARKRDYRGRKKILSAVDCLLLVLFILRTGATQQMAALAFGIHRSTVSRYFTFGIQWLYGAFKAIKIMHQKDHEDAPPAEVRDDDMYFCIILDGTEVGVQRFASMAEHRVFYSNYKSRDTLKWLVGLSPCGHISFISDAFPGAISDADLTQLSEVLAEILTGPAGGVMADKGFLSIAAALGTDINSVFMTSERT